MKRFLITIVLAFSFILCLGQNNTFNNSLNNYNVLSYSPTIEQNLSDQSSKSIMFQSSDKYLIQVPQYKNDDINANILIGAGLTLIVVPTIGYLCTNDKTTSQKISHWIFMGAGTTITIVGLALK